MTKLLLVEDDVEMASFIKSYLSKYNIETKVELDISEIIFSIQNNEFDIVVLDINLPQYNGLNICKEIRQICQIPIIISSARGEISDKAIAYEKGADDYLAKPYEPRELVLKVEAILKRCKRNSKNFAILDNCLSVIIDGISYDFNRSEFKIIKYLINNKNKIVTREELLNYTPELHYDSQNRMIDVYISKIRQKLQDNPKNPKFVKSIWGSGYKWIM
jgi:DNA-binding response OmpR family regulator